MGVLVMLIVLMPIIQLNQLVKWGEHALGRWMGYTTIVRPVFGCRGCRVTC